MAIELKNIDFKTHPITKNASDMQSICEEHLKHMHIDCFCYNKLTEDKNKKMVSILTTAPFFSTDIYYPEKFYESSFFGNPSKYNDGFYLLSFLQKSSKLMQAVRQNLKLEQVITFVKRKNNYCEFYCFGTKNSTPLINQLFMANIDQFENAILAFHNKASDLINTANENTIILPSSANDDVILPAQQQIQELGQALPITQTRANLIHIFYNLPLREKQCAKLLLEGLTAKQIAKKIGLSFRTVDIYSGRIKKRFDCKNKSQLIKILAELSFSLKEHNKSLE